MKAVRGERYIYRRGDQLYFRRGVPDDVRGLFGGRAEVQVSLRSSSIAEARHRRQRELDKFEQAIAAYRGELAPSEIAQAPLRPSVRILEAGVREAFAERMERVQGVNRADPDAVYAVLRRLEDLKCFLRQWPLAALAPMDRRSTSYGWPRLYVNETGGQSKKEEIFGGS